MIALAGLWSEVLLIDFEIRLDDGVPLKQAIIEAGARTSPILWTTAAVVIGAHNII
jgi:multidrug efflux pump subunit AcrB